MSKRRHKNSPKGASPKPKYSAAGGLVLPASAATPDAHDLDDMSAALARAMETVPEPIDMSVAVPDDALEQDHDATDAIASEVMVADAIETDTALEAAPAEVAASTADDQAVVESRSSAHGKSKADRKKLKLHKHDDAAATHEATRQDAVREDEPAVAEQAPLPPREPHVAAFAKLADYERLSLAHVPGLPEQADEPGHWRGVGFGLGKRRLVTSFDEVVEIMSLPQITHVPGTQPWMLGVANVRGTLLPVVDLKQFLEGERTVIHEAQRVLVVRQTGGNVAVLIDALFGQRSFNDAQMTTVDDEEGRYGYFIKQVYRVGDNDWGVFSMSMLTRTPEFRQAAA
jgi:twitching motility protein PilI